jgi:hypothetical protein
MEQLQELWRPLAGQLVWSVRRGVGSFLTMEFGEPHLSIREPITPRVSRSAKVQRMLKRRRVFIEGDWHFWIQWGHWKLRTAHGSLDFQAPSGSPLDECLADLDGQRLVSARADRPGKVAVWEFDQGGLLEIGHSGQEDEEPQWSLHRWNGDVIELCGSRILSFDKDTWAARPA